MRRVIRYRVSESDLSSATFGVSALSETTLSLRAIWRPERYPHMAPWRRAIEGRLAQVDLELLLALIAPDYSTPDFLNPRPDSRHPHFDAELRAVSHLPLRVVDADIDAIHPEGRPEALTGPTAAVLERIVTAMDGYWRLCIQPWWGAMLGTLSADIAVRSVTRTREGWHSTIAGLSPVLTITDRELQGWNPSGPWFDSDARGRGVVFVPTHFTPHVSYPFSAQAPPYILYPARGRGNLTAPTSPTAPQRALTHLLGTHRADLLLSLDEPVSSSEIARRRGITVSAANQQMRWLAAAGLVAPVRHGRSVLYHQTAAARSLLRDLGHG